VVTPLARGGSRAAYALGVGLAVLAVAASSAIGPLQDDAPYLLSYAAVMFASWHGGLGPGLLTSLIAVVGVDYFVRGSGDEFASRDDWNALSALAFLIVSVLVTWLNERRLRADAGVTRALADEQLARRDADEGHDRMAFLLQVSLSLASSFEIEAALRRIAALVVPRFADWCAIYLLEDDGTVRRLASAGSGSGDLAWVAHLPESYPAAEGEPTGLRRMLSTRGPRLISNPPAELVDDVEGLAATQTPSSAMVAPLVSRGRVLGALIFASSATGRVPYSPDDLSFIELLARRCAQATDNTRLFRDAQAAEARYRALFRGTADAVLVADLEGRLIDANAAASAMLDFSRAELLQLKLRDVAPIDWEWSGEQWTPTGGDGTWSGEVMLRRKSGATFPAEGVGQAVELPTGTVFVGAWRDVSERKALERLQQEFLASVSHDLKNPLAAALALTQLVRRRLRRGASLDPQDLETTMERIEDSLGRTTSLLEELSDVARARLGQPLDLERAPADLVALARGSAQQHQLGTDRHHIRVRSEPDPVIGEWDAARVTRVLDNLISNALKYSPDGGEIEVAIRVEGSGPACQAVLEVRDSGVGIPAPDLPNIFRRYYRGSNVLDRFGGTGIGLAGARQIVEQHGGTIHVASDEGRGSTFTVRLPCAPSEGS
jgi:PAS domain S-box-containing protein